MGKRPDITTKLDRSSFVLKALVTAEHRQHSQQFPSEFIGEARLRMAALKSEGHIEAFAVFDQEVDQIWQKFRRKHSVDRVEIVVAAGRPKLPGVVVEVGGEGNTIGWLTLSAGRLQVASWSPYWLLLKVAESIGAEILTAIDPAHVYGYWAKYAFNGEPVIRKPLKRVELINPLRKGQEVRLSASADGSQLEALFGTFRPFRDAELKRELLEQIESQTQRLAQAPEASGYWRTLPFLIEEAIEYGSTGVQCLGVGLPVNTLAGICMTDSPFSGDVIGGMPLGSGALYANILREMLRLDGAEFSVNWFVQHLRGPLSEESIKALMAVLHARGIVSRGEKPGEFGFPDTVHSVGFRSTEKPLDAFHLAAAKSAISAYQLARSDALCHKGTCLAMNESSLAELRDEFAQFRERLLAIVTDCRRRDCLYQMNMQLFPLTRRAVDYRLIVTDNHAHRAEDIDPEILRPLLLDLARMEIFRADGPWIAGKLIVPCTPGQCNQALAALKEENALVFDVDAGRIVDARGEGNSADGTFDEQDPDYQEFMLQAAEICSTKDQINRFHIATMMLPISSLEVQHIADECSLMVDRLKRIAMQSRGKDQLFRVNLTLFPQSK